MSVDQKHMEVCRRGAKFMASPVYNDLCLNDWEKTQTVRTAIGKARSFENLPADVQEVILQTEGKEKPTVR
jgi:hypothetical protein